MRELFTFKVKDGKMDFGNKSNLLRLEGSMERNEGKMYCIELMVTTRTFSQNKFYWLYLGIIERETGNLASDLHEFFKSTLLPKRTITVTGKNTHTLEVSGSTTELSKAEFMDYMDKISAMTDVPIPDPKLLSNY